MAAGLKGAPSPPGHPEEGTPAYATAPAQVGVVAYGPHELSEHTLDDAATLHQMRGRWPVLWVDISGAPDADLVRGIAESLGVRLPVPDGGTRVERSPDQLSVAAAMVGALPVREAEPIGISVAPGVVVTIHPRPDESLATLRGGIRAAPGRLRGSGVDVLLAAILRAVVERYPPVVDGYAGRLERIETEITRSPGRESMAELYAVKRELLALRGRGSRLCDALSTLVGESHPLIGDGARGELREARDRLARVAETLAEHRDLGSALTDLYLSRAGGRVGGGMPLLLALVPVSLALGVIVGMSLPGTAAAGMVPLALTGVALGLVCLAALRLAGRAGKP